MIMASGGSVKDTNDGVPSGFFSEGAISLEVDGLGKCVGIFGERLPEGPPSRPCPRGDNDHGADLVLFEFFQYSVEQGPRWVDVRTLLGLPVVGKGVVSRCSHVAWVCGEIAMDLMVLA